MNNKKVVIISSIILAVLVLTIGITYSIFSLSKVSKNSNLVVGDIYMHYNETTNAINITDMMPTSTIKVNTSADKVTKCVEYLNNTYGREWNNLTLDGSETKLSNDNNNTNVKSIYYSRSEIAGSYSEYCSCKRMTYVVEPRLENNKNEEVLVKPMSELGPSTTITKTIYMLNDLENGTLTAADKKYFEDNGIIEDNTLGLPYFEFTIDGKNTHTKNGVNYNIQIVHGEEETNKTRIQDKFLKFRLVSVDNNQETILKDKLTIDNIDNTTIYSSTIPANATTEIVKTYRLYMWIDGNVNICGGTQTEGCDYNVSDWSNLFASVKVNVNGKYVEATNFVEAIKNRYNGSNQDGLVAVNTAGDLATTSDTIREYRYSGIGNYCTYTDGTNDYNLSVSGSTCPVNSVLYNGAIINGDTDATKLGVSFPSSSTTLNLKNNQTTPTDSGIRNYVKFNNETWRIVGIFNEENASGEKAERIKLVKDEPISLSTEVPTTIAKGNITYEMFNSTSGTKYKYFYWNNPDDNYSGNLDDWTKAGSMYYLNGNYLNSLENSSLIENMKYNLGNVSINRDGFITGIAKEVYTQERGTTVCDSSITSNSHSNNCNIWNGNQASWNGKIALLYPSDYGYASNTSNWSKDFKDADLNGLSLNNWMFNNEMAGTWFLSPASDDPNHVSVVDFVGGLIGVNSDGIGALRPVLSLGSQAMIITGSGSINDPYELAAA